MGLVAPRRGAWIETLTALTERSTPWSHPGGVRGLKLYTNDTESGDAESHPAGVRGLKRSDPGGVRSAPGSHPAGVRGLKQIHSCVFSTPIHRRTPQGCVD